jgi:hypothetical protein
MTETSLHRIFGQLSDPRINRKKKHLLIDIVILGVLAVLSGAESWDAIELYGKEIKVMPVHWTKQINFKNWAKGIMTFRSNSTKQL